MNKFHIGLTKNTESIYEFSNDEIINLKLFYNHNLNIYEVLKNNSKKLRIYFIIKENNKFIKKNKEIRISNNEINEQKKIISNKLIEDVKNMYKDKLIVDNINISGEELSKLDDKELSIFRYIPKIINYINNDIIIDPYYIGYYLGDGTTCRYGEITIGKQDQNIILPYLRNLADRLNLNLKERIKSGKNYPETFNLSGNFGNNILNNEFKKLNLINNKHIPEIYLKSSVENRKALLAGLIDSDGSASCKNNLGHKNQRWEICLKLENLIDDIKVLCESLGMFAYKTIRKSRAHKKDGTYSEYKNYYRLYITPYNNEDIPLKLERKKIILDMNNRQYLPLIKNVKD